MPAGWSMKGYLTRTMEHSGWGKVQRRTALTMHVSTVPLPREDLWSEAVWMAPVFAMMKATVTRPERSGWVERPCS